MSEEAREMNKGVGSLMIFSIHGTLYQENVPLLHDNYEASYEEEMFVITVV